MNDERLLKISLMTACAGLFLLFVMMQSSEEKKYSIEQAIEAKDNDKFTIYAKVDTIKETDKAASITIGEMKMVTEKAVMFKDKNESIGINQGDYVKIKGNKYNGKIIVEEIEKVE